MASSDVQQQPFLSLSTFNAASFAPTKLWFDDIGIDYRAWKDQMLGFIRHQGLLHFIDGTERRPRENQEYDVWRRTDMLVRGWLLCSLRDNEVYCVSAMKTSREVWLDLERKFGPHSSLASSIPGPSMETGRDHVPEELDLFKLIRDVKQGEWNAAQEVLARHPGAGGNSIRKIALSWATGTRRANHIVENLVREMPYECITSLEGVGDTPLIAAAALGNMEIAEFLVAKIPWLLDFPDRFGNFPVQAAAINAERDMLEYLLRVTKTGSGVNPYSGQAGLRLLIYVIDAEFLDIALWLVEKYPELARLTLPDGSSALENISSKKSNFCGERRFTCRERLISSCVSLDATLRPHDFSTGNAVESIIQNGRAVFQRLQVMLGSFVDNILGPIKSIKRKTLLKLQALELVTYMCNKIESLGYQASSDIYVNACMRAAELGIHEVVEKIVEVFPAAIYHPNPKSKKHLIHVAIENRSEHVYNLICDVAEYGHSFSGQQDDHGNNLLHLAGKLAPSHKLDEIPGAALQMQHELQWYKEVEKIVNPRSREQLNKAGKSPKMIFTEQHKQLKEAGEKWMKDTANSCTIAAALIATVMFAAAITVPGGNDSSNGFPIFSSNAAFIVFATSDAISLFTSVTSLLMFLAILTSRYAEEDFLYVLPKRLIIGLGTLFLSITFMTVAFSATIYLVFGRKNAWVLIPVGGLACLPVASFVLLQFPILFDLVSSTYGPGMFSKKRSR